MVEFTTKPWKHPSIRHPVTGESGRWTAVNGRDIFIPSGEQDPVEVGEKELERWEHPPPSNRSSESEPGENPNEEVIKPEETDKDGSGYGDLGNQHTQGTGDNYDAIDDETYIGLPANDKRTKMNKINDTKIGDMISFYINGKSDKGIVAKMGGSYITIVKEDGQFHDVHINDTFFVKNIIIDKSWDDMNSEERVIVLEKAHAPSPRFIDKDWNQLPRELQDVLTKTGFTYEGGVTRDNESEDHDRTGNFQNKIESVLGVDLPGQGENKSDVEQGAYGGIPTNTPFDADEDYEEDPSDKKEQFKLEEQPPVTKDDSVTTDGVNAVYSDVAEKRRKKFADVNTNSWGINYSPKDDNT